MEYIKTNRDLIYEEDGKVKLIKSGTLGKLLDESDFHNLIVNLPKETAERVFEEITKMNGQLPCIIENYISVLDREDYDVYRKMPAMHQLPEEVTNVRD